MSASSSATRTRRGFSASVMAAILAVAGPLSDRGGILYRERPPRPRIPTGRGTGLKTQTVWVRIPPRAPATSGDTARSSTTRPKVSTFLILSVATFLGRVTVEGVPDIRTARLALQIVRL